MAPEDHLCLLLARGELSPGARKQALELLASPLRWDVILRRAAAHQVFPLLYRNLRTLDWPGVPEEARSRIKSAFRLNALRNMQLSAELARLLRVLTEAGISVVPLKGVTLAASLYGDPVLVQREMESREFSIASYSAPSGRGFSRHKEIYRSRCRRGGRRLRPSPAHCLR